MSEILSAANVKEIRSRIVGLAWPAILRLFLQTLVGIIDVIMIGQLGAQAIAAVDVGNRLVFVLIGTLAAMTVGTTALVGHHVGAGNAKRANEIMWQSLLGGGMVALVLVLIGAVFSRQLLSLLMVLMERADPYILTHGSAYLRIVFASMLFAVPMLTINAVLQGIGDMKTPLYIMSVTNVFNVVGNYLLIFGVGPFPELGVVGAALATGLSRVVGGCLGIAVLARGRSGVRLTRKVITWKPDWPILKDILRIAVPAAMEQWVRQSSMILYTALVAGLGTFALAANAIVMNIQSISFMFGFGFGVAATTLVAQSLGAGKKDLADQYGRQVSLMAAVVMGGLGIVLFAGAPVFVDLYTDDPAVMQAAVTALRIIAVVQPLFGLVLSLAGALRGAGDTKWVMYITALGNWGVRLAASLLFAFALGLGLTGFWLAASLDISVRSFAILWRHRTGRWKGIRVMQATAGREA